MKLLKIHRITKEVSDMPFYYGGPKTGIKTFGFDENGTKYKFYSNFFNHDNDKFKFFTDAIESYEPIKSDVKLASYSEMFDIFGNSLGGGLALYFNGDVSEFCDHLNKMWNMKYENFNQ